MRFESGDPGLIPSFDHFLLVTQHHSLFTKIGWYRKLLEIHKKLQICTSFLHQRNSENKMFSFYLF